MATGKIRRIIAAVALLALIGTASVDARQCRHRANIPEGTSCASPGVQPTRGAQRQFEFAVTDVIFKPDDNLIRICGDLTGKPHTSARIDSIALKLGNREILANDIDGVDFERYFQWEDDGIIALEIDIPGYDEATRLLGSKDCEMVFHTVKGDVIIPVTYGHCCE